jgi:hypothetical protein
LNQTKKINGIEWSLLLDKFQEKVKNDKYNKINYNTWRHISQKISANDKITLEFSQNENNIKVCMYDEYFLWDIQDCSIGNFIYNEYFVDKNIINVTNSALSANEFLQSYCDLNGLTICDDLTLSTNNLQSYKPSSLINNLISDWASVDGQAAIDAKVDKSEFNEAINELTDKFVELKETINKNNEKENKTMKFNFDFGTCEGHNIRMSMYGLAVQNADNTWVSYNPNTNEIVDVDIFNFDGAKYLYKMPVAIKDVAVGDMIIHSRVPMYVSAISADQKTITAIDVRAGETKTIMLARSPFGFNFVTKVVNLFGGMLADNAPSETNPFGNMWMFMMMSDDKDMKDMLPFMLMAQGGNMMSNPMMMYMLMNDKDGDKDMLLPLMMMSMNQSAHADGYLPVAENMDNAALDTAPAAPTI